MQKTGRRNGKTLLRDIVRYRQLYLLILPAVVALFLFHYMPIYGMQIAFRDFRASLGIINSPWVGLKHFERFFNYPAFWRILGNTLTLSLYTLLLHPLPVILALMLNSVRIQRFKKTVQMVSYAPHFVSTVVISSMLILFLNEDTGIINKLLGFLGGTPQNWMTKPEYFSSIYVWSGVWQGIGWGSIIYIAALSSISPELHEAAVVDGASKFQLIWYVDLPSILPAIILMFILKAGHLLSVGYEKVYLLQNPLNLDASQVIATYVYKIGLQGGQYSYSSAIGLFNNVTNIIIILAVNGISKRISNIGLF